ncbi:tol-pal system YbgF family protein [Candidatus Latescibacterota bacterium]
MKSLWTVSILVLIIALASGCSMGGKKLTDIDKTVKDQQSSIKSAVERVDNNASLIQGNNNALVEIERRLAALEAKINDSLAQESTGLMEMKENLSFLNDQVLRLDNSVRTNRPAPRPKPASAFKPDGFDVKTSYEAARAEYEARKYESAISGFMEVLTVAPNSSYADNSYYWIGESYYSLGSFEKALDAFNKVFDYPKSNKLADSHFKVAKTYLRMGNNDAAKDEFTAVVQKYPGTSAEKYSRTELEKLGE